MTRGIGGVPRPGTRSGRPVLYLDVDGVLNPESPRDGFTEHAIGRLTVRISAAHGEWLQELAVRYDLVWATTWERYANEYIGPLLGLPELPYVAFNEYDARTDDPRSPPLQIPRMRKWAPILRHADGRAFAWVDDVIPYPARRQALPHRAVRLVPVNAHVGLTRRQTNGLLRWARRVTG